MAVGNACLVLMVLVMLVDACLLSHLFLVLMVLVMVVFVFGFDGDGRQESRAGSWF